ncbi:transporter, partial [Vibrio sp. S234-5]
GRLIRFMLGAITGLLSLDAASAWFKGYSVERHPFGTLVFYVLTILSVQGGVKQGIEKWSTCLMPALLVLFAVLFVYIMTQNGAMEGLNHYLVPDFRQVWDRKLILAAMGQGFFSLIIGGCSLLLFGPYLCKKENLPI